MKKLSICFLVLLILLFGVSCKTTEVVVLATWTQEIPNKEIFGGWEIYMSLSENGTYSFFKKIPFSTESEVYSNTTVIDVPEDKTTIRWFKMLSYNKTGEKSLFSNKALLMVSP